MVLNGTVVLISRNLKIRKALSREGAHEWEVSVASSLVLELAVVPKAHHSSQAWERNQGLEIRYISVSALKQLERVSPKGASKKVMNARKKRVKMPKHPVTALFYSHSTIPIPVC